MSDYIERACTNCGSYLHHEDDCPKEKITKETVEIKKESKCRFCGQPCIIDGGICYDCHLSTR